MAGKFIEVEPIMTIWSCYISTCKLPYEAGIFLLGFALNINIWILSSLFEQSKLIFGLVKLTPHYEVHIYTQGEIFVEDDISAYEYSNIRVRKCSALSHKYSRPRSHQNMQVVSVLGLPK